MPVLDASFLIDLETGNEQAQSALQHLLGQDMIVPGQSALEVMSGNEEPAAALNALRASYRLLLPRDETLVAGARLRLTARREGRRPSGGDVYIAAEAHLHATYVVTANPKDFKALGCAVWDYRKGGMPP